MAAHEGDGDLRYEVPNGQDPAVVLAALEQAGYACSLHTDTALSTVSIRLPNTQAGEVERVRAVLADARASTLGGPPVVDTTPVHFLGDDPDPLPPSF